MTKEQAYKVFIEGVVFGGGCECAEAREKFEAWWGVYKPKRKSRGPKKWAPRTWSSL